MTIHRTVTKYGKTLHFQAPTDWADSPLSLRLGGGTEVLVRRADAIKLRDMLIETLGLPEPEAPQPTTSKLGEVVTFNGLSNRYTLVDRSPFGMKVFDSAGNLKYNFGKYTVELLREYFDRPYVAPKPTIKEQFAALKLGAQFRFTDGTDDVAIKVSDTQYFRAGLHHIGAHTGHLYGIEEVADNA
jgi:hypothetical protein